MILNLKQIYDAVGEKTEFCYDLGSGLLPVTGGRSFPEGAHVSGCVFNRAGIVSLEGTADVLLAAECDRCLRPLERRFRFDLSHILVRSLNGEDNDEYIVTDGDDLDLDELVYSDILLQIPTKLLCSDDCKGLCPVCGADLNISPCGCNA